jgi:hypothetical protein
MMKVCLPYIIDEQSVLTTYVNYLFFCTKTNLL